MKTNKGLTALEVIVLMAIVGGFIWLIASSVHSIPKTAAVNQGTIGQLIFPEASNYVVDDAGILKPETITALDTDLKNFESKGEIAVLTVDSTSPLSIEEYGIQLADKWKVGHAGKDDGVIFILAVKDRKVRIEVGTGAEAVLTDVQSKHIIDDITPKLKAADWDGAVTQAVTEIKSDLTNLSN